NAPESVTPCSAGREIQVSSASVNLKGANVLVNDSADEKNGRNKSRNNSRIMTSDKKGAHGPCIIN
ncbi:hypothetical protein, partial [Escherichia coli]|uniref:hypothetical protein n=1 Tax=Escherichia coli TaxID=562 RepID=UPI001BAEF292